VLVETRIRIWVVTAVLTLAAGGVAYAQRPPTKPERAPQPRVELPALPRDAAEL
jgi:hypothetical protein